MTVPFGPEQPETREKPLDWPAFEHLLPVPERVLTVTPTGGISEIQDSTDPVTGKPAKRWVARATGLGFRTSSAIPASALSCGGATAFPISGVAIPIRPMNLKEVTSAHVLTLHEGEPEGPACNLAGWTVEAHRRNMPDSLWSPPPEPFSQTPAQPSATLAEQQLVGYAVAAPPPTLAAPRGVISIDNLEQHSIAQGALPLVPGVSATGAYIPTANAESIALVTGIHAASESRSQLFGALAHAEAFSGEDNDMSGLAAAAAHSFSDPPLVQS